MIHNFNSSINKRTMNRKLEVYEIKGKEKIMEDGTRDDMIPGATIVSWETNSASVDNKRRVYTHDLTLPKSSTKCVCGQYPRVLPNGERICQCKLI